MHPYGILRRMTTSPHEQWWPEVSFGDRLRIVRRGRDRTQEEMAKLLGVNKPTYSAWESGRNEPSHREVRAVARRLEMLDNVPAAWTLGAYDSAPTQPGGPEGGEECAIRDSNPEPADSARPRRLALVA